MAVTLLEAAKLGTMTDYRRAVIETFAMSNDLLMRMPFESITGNAISITQESALPDAEFRSINAAYTEASGTFSKVTETLAICGGDVDIDRFLMMTGNEGMRASQEAGKIKRIGHLFGYKVIKGDVSSDPNEFDGLQKRVTGTSQEVTNAANGAGLSLAALEETIDLVSGPRESKVLITNLSIARRFKAAARPSGSTPAVAGEVLYGTGWGALGTGPAQYDGIPILVLDGPDSVYTALPFTETQGGSSACTSVYCVNLAPGYFTGIQNGPPMVDDLGMLQTAPKYRTRIEWYASIALWHPRAVARLKGVTNAAITA